MTSREFARYNPKITIEHPDDDMPDDAAAPLDVIPLKKKPALNKDEGWKKTKLEKAGVKGDWLTLKDDIGFLQMNWKSLTVGSDTYRNLVRLLKGDDRAWRVKWRSDFNGVRYVIEILDNEQYKRYQKTSWQNRKLYREGFSTANPFIS